MESEIQNRIKNKQKYNWILVKLQRNQIYYGEFIRINKENQVVENDNQDNRRVRHGLGVQFYEQRIDNESVECKYEGEWVMDRRQGKGRMYYQDKSIYEGEFKNDMRDGHGKMIFNNMWVYTGTWRNNRMEGRGTLTDPIGNTKSRVFKKNFMLEDEKLGIFAWPFFDEQQLKQFLNNRQNQIIEADLNKSQNNFYIEKTNTYQQIAFKINSSADQGRVALILTSQSNTDQKLEVINKIIEKLNIKKFHELDLRLLDHLNQNNRLDFQEYRNKIKENLSECISEGYIFLINIDDNQDFEFNDNQYPDFREYYNYEYFPSQIWEKQHLLKIIHKLFNNTQQQNKKYEIHNNFRILIWSKYKINESLSKKKINEVFEKRYGQVLPLDYIDLIVISK